MADEPNETSAKSRKALSIAGLPEEELFSKGHRACAGCGAAIAMRHIVKATGKDVIITHATGCMEVISSPYPQTAWKVPWIHTAFENAAAVASGVRAALKQLNSKTKVLTIGGDGGTFDIGLQSLSGAVERNTDFTYICYDNGAYMNCLSLDSFIMTEDGLKKITEIKKGENVYAFNQKTGDLTLKRCTGIFDNGIKKVFELNTLHHTIKTTSNHPFLVLKRNGRGKKSLFVWRELKDLKKNDEVVVLKKSIRGKSFKFKPIKLSKKGDYKVNKINNIKIPKISSPELMEFLGLYVGDGWVRPQKTETGFALPKNTKGSKRLIDLHNKLFNKNLVQKERNYIYIYSINFANFIDSLGFGKGAKNKIIPDWVFTLPDSEKEAFVKGLMLSDGYKINNSHRYVSASYNLLKTLRLLLQTIDYQVGKIHQQTKKKGTHVVYRQLLEDSTYGYICFSKKRKANVSKYASQIKQRDFLIDNDHFSTEKVTSINFVKKEPTLDLRVEGEHNFVADGIVVHNTGIQRSGATPRYAATTTSPAGKVIHGKVEWKKQMPFIMAAHGKHVYVATANIAYPLDFYNKVKKGLAHKGPAYIQVYTPCVPGWKIPSNITITLSELAFKSKVTPLYEIEDGILTINKKPEKEIPVKEYLKLQGRFKHLDADEIDDIQKHIDEQWNNIVELDKSKVTIP